MLPLPNDFTTEIEAFLKQSTAKEKPFNSRAWFECPLIKIYLRSTWRPMPPEYVRFVRCVDVANIEVPENLQGNGVFTNVMENIEVMAKRHGYDMIYIENVLSPKFERSQFKHDFEKYKVQGPVGRASCLYKKLH